MIEFEEHHVQEDTSQNRIGHSLDLETALAELDEIDRTIVWLHDVEGYSHVEIAKLYEQSESFSKTRLSRARARLRERMENLEERCAVSGVVS